MVNESRSSLPSGNGEMVLRIGPNLFSSIWGGRSNGQRYDIDRFATSLTHMLRYHTWVSYAIVNSQTTQSLGETFRLHGQQEQLRNADGCTSWWYMYLRRVSCRRHAMTAIIIWLSLRSGDNYPEIPEQP